VAVPIEPHGLELGQTPVSKLAALLNDGLTQRQAVAQKAFTRDEAELEALFKTA